MKLPDRRPMSKRAEANAAASRLMHDVRDAVAAIPGVLIWRNSVAVAFNERGDRMRVGLAVGSSDLIGLVNGRFLAIEVKMRGPGDLSDEQRAFLDVVNRHGGAGACVSSVAEAVRFVDATVRETVDCPRQVPADDARL